MISLIQYTVADLRGFLADFAVGRYAGLAGAQRAECINAMQTAVNMGDEVRLSSFVIEEAAATLVANLSGRCLVNSFAERVQRRQLSVKVPLIMSIAVARLWFAALLASRKTTN